MPHTKISFSVFVYSLAILNHRKFGDSFSTEIQSLKFDLKIKARPPELRPHFLFGGGVTPGSLNYEPDQNAFFFTHF